MSTFKKILLFTVIATFVMAGSASATPFYFYNITNNGNSDLAGQLSVAVTPKGSQVDFTFTNSVGIASSITDIYFEDGTLLGIASISDSDSPAENYVAFSQLASPGDLPGRTPVGFLTTAGFSADSDAPVMENGVNASTEWVTITFDLINGQTYADTIAALNSGELRIGLHVQSIGTTGGSDSYVNRVPDGGMTLMLLGGALVGLGALRRKFRA